MMMMKRKKKLVTAAEDRGAKSKGQNREDTMFHVVVILTILSFSVTEADFPYFCSTQVTSNSVTYNADEVVNGVRFRLVGAEDGDRRRRRLSNVDCSNNDYDFVSHCELDSTNFDAVSSGDITCLNGVASKNACLNICRDTWVDSDTSWKCKTVQYRDNDSNENCCYSSIGVYNSRVKTEFDGDSHHWCFFASNSACFGEPIVNNQDSSVVCANTPDGDVCANFRCASGYTVTSAPTCNKGSWNNDGLCTQNTCTLPSDLGLNVIGGTYRGELIFFSFLSVLSLSLSL